MKKGINLDMELTVEGLGETLKLTESGALFIGNENDHNHTSVFLEDISQVQNKKLVQELEQLHKIVSEATVKLKHLAIESYHNEPMIEGALDKVKDIA